jgi:hypothetical protein
MPFDFALMMRFALSRPTCQHPLRKTAHAMEGALPHPPYGWLGSPEERWPWTARLGFDCIGSSAAYWHG